MGGEGRAGSGLVAMLGLCGLGGKREWDVQSVLGH